ncbi:hypothetical protein XENTR_v10005073 [Xenopus tropicalis]|nr:hypothetical protein XENTR_v10005073 [Xenopus tropicalis]
MMVRGSHTQASLLECGAVVFSSLPKALKAQVSHFLANVARLSITLQSFMGVFMTIRMQLFTCFCVGSHTSFHIK